MDGLTVVWYAAICGVLSAFAPSFGGRKMRLVIGAIVGILAASLFPFMRGFGLSMIGYQINNDTKRVFVTTR